MKNKILLSIVAALGLASVNNGNSQTLGPVTFVDVKTYGDSVGVVTGSGGSVKVDATILTKSQRWTKDKVWLLERNVIVPSGITLTIEPGTLIRAARPSKEQGASGADLALSPADPGAIVVARGGRIIAAGTADAPIIVTCMDDPNVPGGAATIPVYENYGVTDSSKVRTLRSGFTTISGDPTAGGEYTISGGTTTLACQRFGDNVTDADSKWAVSGQFGGLVIAGYAEVVNLIPNGTNALNDTHTDGTISNSTGSASGQRGVMQIEGMASFPDYALGGGDNDTDDSGIVRFMDLRYGGYVIASGKELNSYSLYGVGRNTVFEFNADWNNKDDSFEVWGSSLNIRHCLSAFCGDDGLDTDQGYTGTVQFFVQIQNNAIDSNGNESTRSAADAGDSQSENDGPEAGNSAFPYTVYTLANATFIGRGYNNISARTKALAQKMYPGTGPNYKDNGSTKVYNTLFMDSPHGAFMIMDKITSGTPETNGGNSAINRFTVARTTGGFDGAGRAKDLTFSGATSTDPGECDGLFNNVWFFRDALIQIDWAGLGGKYASLTALNDAITADPTGWWKPVSTSAADMAYLFPTGTDTTERGAGTNGTVNRANTTAMLNVIKASNGVKFDADPGVEVPLNHHLSGIDIKPTASAARDVAINQLPNYDQGGTVKTTRSLVTGASFVGAVRDSSWFRGWNFASQSGMFKSSAVAIVPTVSVSKDTDGKPLVNFGAEAGVKYSLEVSTDNKSFVPVTVLQSSDLPYKDTARTVGTTALYYRSIAL